MPTSTHWAITDLRKISVKTVRFAGPMWASAPTGSIEFAGDFLFWWIFLRADRDVRPYDFHPAGLLLRYQHFLAAHIRLEDLRDRHGAVFLQVVLEERDEHSGGRDAGIVERMRKIRLAVFTLDADAKPSRLRVAEV